MLARFMTDRAELHGSPEEASLEYLRAFLIRLGLIRPAVWSEGSLHESGDIYLSLD